MLSKKIKTVSLITFGILSIPFIGMQFTSEINWTLLDFVVMGGLLFFTGFGIITILQKKRGTLNMIYVGLMILIFLLIWAELAVGIFGSPFAGS